MPNSLKHILITGGLGYVGSRLVPQLLKLGYKVTVFDTGYFGWSNWLPQGSNLKTIIADIRSINSFSRAARGCDAVLHLAAISNDASFALDPALSTSTNLDCFEPLVIAAKENGVKRFIYASSSSVYGVSEEKNVTEDHPLVPLTLYNRYKGDCEPLLLTHQSEDFTTTVIRPATICGFSPRMRLDLSVNILTNHAYNLGKITVFGGSQMRPNLHIQDMCDLYQLLLEAPKEKIAGQTFNVGNENLTISELAQIVKERTERFTGKTVEIVTEESNDLRSYHVCSDKIANVLGFKPKLSVPDAVDEMLQSFAQGLIPNAMADDNYYNVRKMKKIGAQ